MSNYKGNPDDRSGFNDEVFYKFSKGQLFLITINDDALTFKLTGDFAVLWLHLLDLPMNLPETKNLDSSEKNIQAFLSFLSSHNLLPHRHSIQTALKTLSGLTIPANLTGDYGMEKLENSTPVFASWAEDAYGCPNIYVPESPAPINDAWCK